MRYNKGFTLVEILIVMVIAASVLVFALPANKKAQERNKYLAATGILADLGMAVQALRMDMTMQGVDDNFPQGSTVFGFSSTSWQTTDPHSSQYADISSLNSTTFPYALFSHKYLQHIPFDSGATYKGYTFYICPVETASTLHQCNGDLEVIATMENLNSTAYRGARFMQDGTIVQVSD